MSNKIIVLSTSTCGPCKTLSSMLNTLDIPHIKYIDDTEMFLKYNVYAVPTTIIIDDNGFEVKRHVGLMSNSELLRLVNAWSLFNR